MARFITIGYGDQAGYDQTEASVREAAHAHDQRLQEAGAIMGIAGAPVQVRNHDGAGAQASKSAFMDAELPVAGFSVIDATDIDEAIELVSQTPCAVAHGVVEVWPLAAGRNEDDITIDIGGAERAADAAPVVVAGHLLVDPDGRDAYLEGCRDVVAAARATAGCLDFAISADLIDPSRINILERWQSQAAVDAFRGNGVGEDQSNAIRGGTVDEFDTSGERKLL